VASTQPGKMAQTGVDRRRLAAARRAGEQKQAARLPKKRFQFRAGNWGKFNFFQVLTEVELNRRRTIFSPVTVGYVATRMSFWLLSSSRAMRPSAAVFPDTS